MAILHNDKESVVVVDSLSYLRDSSVDAKVREQRFRQGRAYFICSGEMNAVASMRSFPVLGPSVEFDQAHAFPSGLRVASDALEQLTSSLPSALASSPESAAGALTLLGSLELEAGRHAQAKEYLNMALQMRKRPTGANSATRVHANELLGCIALETEQWDESEKLLRQALDIVADNPAAIASTQQDALSRLLELR